MINPVRVHDAKNNIVDNLLIVGLREVKGYTTKKHLKEQMAKLRETER